MAEVFSHVSAILGIADIAARVAKLVPKRYYETDWASPLEIISNPSKPEVDIVFVHGLGVDSASAWSEEDVKTGRTLCWPETELGQDDLGVRARVTTYEYDSKFRTAEYLTRRTLLHQTKHLLEDLAKLPQPHDHRRLPVIFVCHSLGGIIVKNALASARNSEDPKLLDVCDATAGIIFLGTPNSASPSTFADSVVKIVKGLDNAGADELRERSRTLAYSLERFKPLAARLKIYAFYEKGSDECLQMVDSGSNRHVQTLNRDHSRLCRFSDPKDPNLRMIIDAIKAICTAAKEKLVARPCSEQRSSAREPAATENQVHSLVEEAVLKSLAGKSAAFQLEALESFFSRWHEKSNSKQVPADKEDPWPVAVLSGVAGCGKTQTSLEYVRKYRDAYGTVMWIDASTRKSMELSIREIKRQIQPQTQQQLNDFDVFDRQEDDGHLDEEVLYALVRRVTEWLERPQEKKWLLVFDNVSHDSPYPSQPSWADEIQTRRTWGSLLRLIPSVTGRQGHVILCTTETENIPRKGLKVITFTPNTFTPDKERDARSSSLLISDKTLVSLAGPKGLARKAAKWWKENGGTKAQRQFALALVMSDKRSPRVPLFLLHEAEEDNCQTGEWPVDVLVTSDDGGMKCVVLPESFLDHGLDDLVSMTKDALDVMIRDAREVAWGRLLQALASLRTQPNPVFGWNIESQLVKNITATLRRYKQLVGAMEVRPRHEGYTAVIDESLADLARVCEEHLEYDTAAELYKLELDFVRRQRDSDYAKMELWLQLDYARVCGHDKQEKDLEKKYESIISSLDVPLVRIEALRQLASWYASVRKYGDAIGKLSEALGKEDPFGAEANERPVTGSVAALSAYLVKKGDRFRAAALLQRLVLTLEDTRGRDHPSTLSAMEALSVIKQDEGEFGEACSVLRAVYEHQRRRLGDEHPSTVLSHAKLAAAQDLAGDQQQAEQIYRRCLRLAVKTLGSHHPSVFGIRENLARCLLAQGEDRRAAPELEILRHELDDRPGLYSKDVRHRIRRLLGRAAGTTVDDDELARRNTLGVDDLDEDTDGESDSEDSVDDDDEEEDGGKEEEGKEEEERRRRTWSPFEALGLRRWR